MSADTEQIDAEIRQLRKRLRKAEILEYHGEVSEIKQKIGSLEQQKNQSTYTQCDQCGRTYFKVDVFGKNEIFCEYFKKWSSQNKEKFYTGKVSKNAEGLWQRHYMVKNLYMCTEIIGICPYKSKIKVNSSPMRSEEQQATAEPMGEQLQK